VAACRIVPGTLEAPGVTGAARAFLEAHPEAAAPDA
jgi:hypothetical protein